MEQIFFLFQVLHLLRLPKSGKQHLSTGALLDEKQVTLFIPCLVDQLYPEIGVALCNVLSAIGWSVNYTPEHTCCGQPAFNAGHRPEAKQAAAAFVAAFPGSGEIVTVSGSCTAMVRVYYEELFQEDARLPEVSRFVGRLAEFSEFIHRHDLYHKIQGVQRGRVGFHNSCHSFRELHIEREPLRILRCLDGFELIESANIQICCGFGGVFYLKYSTISSAMGGSRLQYFLDAGADTVVANDPGCIMQMRQEAASRKLNIRIYHLVEFLAQAMGLGCELNLSKRSAG